MAGVKSFRDLIVWQEAHQLTLMIYKSTEEFPKQEVYGLTSQMRRSAVSVPANIVEGFKRNGWNEKVRFYNIAEASLEELKYFVILSTDLGYIESTTELTQQADSVGRLLNRFIQTTKQHT